MDLVYSWLSSIVMVGSIALVLSGQMIIWVITEDVSGCKTEAVHGGIKHTVETPTLFSKQDQADETEDSTKLNFV